MKRDLKALAGGRYDVVVVGAGVYGAAIAWDACLRGLSVALVDKADFGGATSFNNLKTIHGGLRYLQHGDLRRMRESIRERRTLMRIAPHLVHPLPFLVPTYRDWKRGRLAMATAMLLNDLVSFDRNRLDDPEKFLPAGRVISRAECLELAPGVEEKGLTGAAVWYDAQMFNSDRMTLSFVLSAAKAGAQVANHAEVTGFLREGSRIVGVRARDGLGDEELDIRSRVVVNAAGPWVDRLLHRLDRREGPPLFHFSKAVNVVTRPLVGTHAVGFACKREHRDGDAVISKGGRFLFIVPWRGTSLIGTGHGPYSGEPDELEATEEDIRELLHDVNDAYPAAKLRREDVRLVHRGLLPMVPTRRAGDDITLVKKYRIQDHREEGIEGLLSVIGVKYTTARDVAEKAVDRVFILLGKKPPPSRSPRTRLWGGSVERFGEFLSEEVRRKPLSSSEDGIRHLVTTYGSAYREVLRHIEKEPELARPVTEDSPVIRAEVVHAVREEQAVDLASVVLRRTELGSAGHPGRPCLETVAEIMSHELRWDETRKRAEIDSLEKLYRRRS